MKHYLAAGAAALALMFAAAPAAAATPIVLDANGFGIFGSTVSGNFFHEWEVTFPAPGTASESVTAVKLTGHPGITFTDVLFDGIALTQTSFGNVQNFEITDLAVTAGAHLLTVAGAAPSGGSYSGNMQYNAIPEPATWALMILGFGGAGVALRARRHLQPA